MGDFNKYLIICWGWLNLSFHCLLNNYTLVLQELNDVGVPQWSISEVPLSLLMFPHFAQGRYAAGKSTGVRKGPELSLYSFCVQLNLLWELCSCIFSLCQFVFRLLYSLPHYSPHISYKNWRQPFFIKI